MSDRLSATVIVDASFCNRTKSGGWAAWIAIDHGVKIRKGGVFHKRPKTSGQAELWAAYNGLWLAIKADVKNILLQSDCMEVVTTLCTPVGRQAFFMGAKLDPGCASIRVRHVKGHKRLTDRDHGTKHWVNDWCDTEAKSWMRAQRNGLT